MCACVPNLEKEGRKEGEGPGPAGPEFEWNTSWNAYRCSFMFQHLAELPMRGDSLATRQRKSDQLSTFDSPQCAGRIDGVQRKWWNRESPLSPPDCPPRPQLALGRSRSLGVVPRCLRVRSAGSDHHDDRGSRRCLRRKSWPFISPSLFAPGAKRRQNTAKIWKADPIVEERARERNLGSISHAIKRIGY